MNLTTFLSLLSAYVSLRNLEIAERKLRLYERVSSEKVILDETDSNDRGYQDE